ncbi:MAG: ribonuclease J [Deltaproteobacteria bacterium]|jgi:ribonuclease J|nr:ribonuclease J [Deltaproteobacteria bacterium]
MTFTAAKTAGAQPKLTLTPYGGLGEIGLNSLSLSYASSMVLIDCGLMFPEDFHLGVDVVIPRFDHLLENHDKLLGLVLTHGHEDHIGALPWLVPMLEHLDIYGSPFTLALVEHKLKEHNLLNRVTLNTVKPNKPLFLGAFKFRFFPVCHSILDGLALGIETPIGKVLHTGDFKLDPDPLSGPGTDLEVFRKYAGNQGIKLLLSDSTNIENEGYSLNEREVFEALRSVFKGAGGRVLVTLFSSNIQRIQEVLDCAKESGRKVVVAGRSLDNNIEMARALGHIRVPKGLIVEASDLPDDFPDSKVVLLVTGSQGEPMSALARIVWGAHKNLDIKRGDTVIMSSRLIPGNTSTVNRLINQLYKLGAEVLYSQVSGIHASGHAYKGELTAMLETMRPEYFIPVHGEYRHLVKHAELAEAHGVARDKIFVLEDGQPISFLHTQRSKKAVFGIGAGPGVMLETPIPAESILVDGKGVGDVGQVILKERQLLGDEGMVIVLLVLDAHTREIILGPEVQSKGFIFEPQFTDMLKNSCNLVVKLLEKEPSKNADVLYDKIRSTLRRYFKQQLGRDPVVIPLVKMI